MFVLTCTAYPPHPWKRHPCNVASPPSTSTAVTPLKLGARSVAWLPAPQGASSTKHTLHMVTPRPNTTAHAGILISLELGSSERSMLSTPAGELVEGAREASGGCLGEAQGRYLAPEW